VGDSLYWYPSVRCWFDRAAAAVAGAVLKQTAVPAPPVCGRVFRDTPLGAAFFGSVATPNTVKNILCQAYANDAAVTDELVDAILKPGLQVSLEAGGGGKREGGHTGLRVTASSATLMLTNMNKASGVCQQCGIH
jgi:hypothetical protein